MENDIPEKGKILNGWKEIAQYLGRGIRTVQRWEHDLGLPVRRPRARNRSAVIALAHELQEWLTQTPINTNLLDIPDREPKALQPDAARILIIEDELGDALECMSMLHKLGVRSADVISGIGAALLQLDAVTNGELPLPSLIILDLAFTVENGFEILHRLKAVPTLRKVPVIVWTRWTGVKPNLCEVFNVRKVVPKSTGMLELEKAVKAAAA